MPATMAVPQIELDQAPPAARGKVQSETTFPQLESGNEDPFTHHDWRQPKSSQETLLSPDSNLNLKPKRKVKAPSIDFSGFKEQVRKYRIPLTVGGLVVSLLVAAYLAFGGENPEYQGKTLSEWAKTVKDVDPETRANALKAIVSIGRAGHARLANRTLVRILNSDEPVIVKMAVADQMADLGRHYDGSYAMQTLEQQRASSTDPDYSEQLDAGILLIADRSKEISIDDKWRVAKQFIDRPEALKEAKSFDRLRYIVEKVDSAKSSEIVSFFGSCLDQDEKVASEAMSALLSLSSEPATRTKVSPAIPYMVKHIRSTRNFNDRFSSCYTIFQIFECLKQPNETLPVILETLQRPESSSNRMYDSALRCLEVMGPSASKALPYLLELQSRNPYNDSLKGVIKAIQG